MTRAPNLPGVVALFAAAFALQVDAALAASQPALVSTTHYQEMLNLTCGAGECFGDLGQVRTGKQLNIARVACVLFGPTGAKPADSEIALVTPRNKVPLFEATPFEFSSDTGSYTRFAFNRAVDVQLAAGQRLRFVMTIVAGTPTSASCTATGTVDTLG